MGKTLTRLTETPAWNQTLYAEVDALEFKHAFDCFLPDAELRSAGAHARRTGAIQELLLKVDGPLICEHHVREFCDGSPPQPARGDIDAARKGGPAEATTARRFNPVYTSEAAPNQVQRWVNVVGPMAARTLSEKEGA